MLLSLSYFSRYTWGKCKVFRDLRIIDHSYPSPLSFREYYIWVRRIPSFGSHILESPTHYKHTNHTYETIHECPVTWNPVDRTDPVQPVILNTGLQVKPLGSQIIMSSILLLFVPRMKGDYICVPRTGMQSVTDTPLLCGKDIGSRIS